MSETFYIKKTAFDDNNFDLAQRETDSFIIGPGELNGPAGLARDSDLELYGFGSLKWGEGVDQNQYRLMESSACPAKEDGDYFNGIIPFDVATHGIVPKSEEDLGIGNGITKPLVGQLWYNTSDNILYNYELTWQTVFQEVTNALTTHEDRTDLHLGSPQNIFLDGLILTGSPALTSYDVNQLIGMGDTAGVLTVQGQLDLMVLRAGDIMTGSLTIDSANAAMALRPDAVNDIPQFIIADHTGTERANFRFTNDLNGNVSIIRRSAFAAIETTLTLGADGNVSLVGGLDVPTAPAHLTRLDYVETKAKIISPIFTGAPKAPTPALSSNDTSIATTKWVKDQTSGLSTIKSFASNAFSVGIVLTEGTWYVEATARYHQAIQSTLTFKIEGVTVDQTSNLGDPPGTTYVQMFGYRENIPGNQIVSASFVGINGWPTNGNAGQRIKITAWRTA